MLHVIIRIKGKLDQSWVDWLDDFSLTYPDPGETLLCGRITDQAALYGLVGKLRDLGIQLVSIQMAPVNEVKGNNHQANE